MPRKKDHQGKKTPVNMTELHNSVPIDPIGISNFVSRSEAESKHRLERMNEKLKDLEKQMGDLEDEMRKANFFSMV